MSTSPQTVILRATPVQCTGWESRVTARRVWNAPGIGQDRSDIIADKRGQLACGKGGTTGEPKAHRNNVAESLCVALVSEQDGHKSHETAGEKTIAGGEQNHRHRVAPGDVEGQTPASDHHGGRGAQKNKTKGELRRDEAMQSMMQRAKALQRLLLHFPVHIAAGVFAQE